MLCYEPKAVLTCSIFVAKTSFSEGVSSNSCFNCFEELVLTSERLRKGIYIKARPTCRLTCNSQNL